MSYSGMAVGGTQMLQGLVNIGKGAYHIGVAAVDVAEGVFDIAVGAVAAGSEAADIVYETVAASGETVINGAKAVGNIIDIFA